MNKQNLLTEFIQLDEDSLLIELGKLTNDYIENADLGIRPPTKKQILNWGKKRFDKIKEKIRPVICSNKILRDFASSKSINNIEYAILIMDLIENFVGELQAPLIALLIIQKGVTDICHD